MSPVRLESFSFCSPGRLRNSLGTLGQYLGFFKHECYFFLLTLIIVRSLPLCSVHRTSPCCRQLAALSSFCSALRRLVARQTVEGFSAGPCRVSCHGDTRQDRGDRVRDLANPEEQSDECTFGSAEYFCLLSWSPPLFTRRASETLK